MPRQVADTLRMLRQPEVLRLTGFSETTLWRREREGKFPRRRRLSGSMVAWRSDEVAAWIESRPAVELGAEETADS